MSRTCSYIVAYPMGRVCLHLAALLMDREWSFHFAGIRREFIGV